ncbi:MULTISPECIES: hypothetical protein [Nostocales]|nr:MULTISPECIES: hypothetical protein [Nostocales]MBD2300418.1 hypothetical protein [Nostoc sp. FACHB-190]MBD2475392.1 hypothetical protein [Anabaena sp. FACHB-83]MBD2489842.1 hypothetical protein [Aulosira sp. FACHB-615]
MKYEIYFALAYGNGIANQPSDFRLLSTPLVKLTVNFLVVGVYSKNY